METISEAVSELYNHHNMYTSSLHLGYGSGFRLQLLDMILLNWNMWTTLNALWQEFHDKH
jgi:hypothetical protein